MINLFTYGSLMCSDIMFKVADQRIDFTQANLSNFFRSKITNREYPGIVAQRGALVPGVLYFDLSVEALGRLDLFEGDMYRRQDVEVITEKGGPTSAMTYVIKPQHADLLTGAEWDFADFLTVGKEKFKETYFGFQEIDS
jgi:gamma-glutamylcyclotransferase (GGCT)/AIG2-like uncharacterized protein YtfP